MRLRVKTGKQGLNAIIIDKHVVVEKNDKSFGIYDADSTNTGITNLDFDETPFLEAFKKWEIEKLNKIAEKVAEKERLIRESKEKEEKRITELKEQISNCNSPSELADAFGLSQIETASHWSDLYEGRSKNAMLISSREEFEIIELAKEIHDWEGEFGEAKRRDGEHHSTFMEVWNGMNGYQKCLKDHFNTDKYFYRSKETDENIFLDQIKDCDNIEDIKGIISTYEELEDGYYDCNGNLEISDEDLNYDELTGYSEDVYTYSFAYQFEYWSEWNQKELEDVDEK